MIQFVSNVYQSIKGSIQDSYQDRRWGMLALKIVMTLSITGCSLYVIGTAAMLLWMNLENIIVTVGAFFVAMLILRGFWEDIFSKSTGGNDGPSEDDFRAMEAILEDNYDTVSLLISMAINDVADILKLKPITSVKDMEAGRHWIRRHTFVLYLFTVLKTAPDMPMDTLKFRDLLNRKIKQKLDSGAFPGLSQSRYVSSGGLSFPILVVDEVLDTGDGFLNIYVAWVGEDYAQYYMANRIRRPSIMGNTRETKDVEF